jgi:hypothetical protein
MDEETGGLRQGLRKLLTGSRSTSSRDVDVRERTSGILERDRAELWDVD